MDLAAFRALAIRIHNAVAVREGRVQICDDKAFRKQTHPKSRHTQVSNLAEELNRMYQRDNQAKRMRQRRGKEHNTMSHARFVPTPGMSQSEIRLCLVAWKGAALSGSENDTLFSQLPFELLCKIMRL